MPSWITELTPRDLGMPEKFQSFHGKQSQAIADIVEDENRIVPLCAPTGTGKSPVAVAAALLNGGRAAYVTSTKALMDQFNWDFRSLGVGLVKGKNNYQCVEPGGYSCADNWKLCRDKACPVHKKVPCSPYECEVWSGACPYKAAYKTALGSSLVLTNYAYWLGVGQAAGLGPVDWLVLDEAHNAPDELCRSMTVMLSWKQLKALGGGAGRKATPEDWSKWATAKGVEYGGRDNQAKRVLLELFSGADPQVAATRVDRLLDSVKALAEVNGDWAIERDSADNFSFEPVWPYLYSGRLFQRARKVILMSATLTPKTLSLLGVKADKYKFHKYPYVFQRSHCPTVHVKTAAASKRNFDSNPHMEQRWLERIGEVLEARGDRKGIVHTVSYARQALIAEFLRRSYPDVGGRLLTHKTADAAAKILKFKSSRDPLVLLSPSVATGYDFPYQECEFIVIPKLPFPSTQSAVMKARLERDDQYAAHVMIQELVQAAGRGLRSADDRCEVLILDDSWFWVKSRYRHLMPSWFQVRTSNLIPRKPPSLSSLWKDDDVPF